MRVGLFVLLIAAFSAVSHCPAQEQIAPQELWPGTVSLATLTSFRVIYQFFGKPIVTLPPAQYGDDNVGATYRPTGTDIFMHPAWKKGPGWTAVEYFLQLPNIRPVHLKFAVGLDPQAVSRSDGVTFRVYLGEYSKRRVLWEKHVKAARSHLVDLDLSKLSGQQIILGLQVHPGPDKSTAYDWAYWFNPRLVIGSGKTGRRLSRRVRRRLEYLYRKGLAPFRNNNTTAAPSPGTLHARTRVEHLGGKRWRFAVESDDRADWDVIYDFDFSDGRLSRLTIKGPDGRTWQPCRSGGIELRVGEGKFGPDSPQVRRELVKIESDSDAVTAHYRYSAAGTAVLWTLKLSLHGPYLQIDATAPEASQGITAFYWGQPYGFRLGRAINIPYMYWGNIWQIGDGFLAAVPDLWHSNASTPARNHMEYRPRSDGQYNPLRERVWIGYVPLLEMAIHNIPHPRSPYFADMASRPVMDIWGGSFSTIESRLRGLARYGVDHTFIIIHNWQRAGYDVQYPDVIPASKGLGGERALKSLCTTANAIGHRIAVHENYVDFYPDAPSFNPQDVALDSHGKWVKAYLHPATHIQSFLLKPLRAIKYARRFAPEIHRRYGTSGAYLDVHTAAGPWGKVDFDARMPDAGKYLQTWRAYKELFAFMRKAHNGPLTGEGGNHAFWAGLFDGAEAQVLGGENVQPILAFDLLKVHQLNVNHGMGYWIRWTSPHPDLPVGARIVLPVLEDKYRTQEITFGHAGFIGSERLGTDWLAVREFYLTRWLQPLSAGAAVEKIEFEVGGRMVPLSQALLAMAPLERIHILYDSGLELWLNWGAKNWRIGRYLLPQWGYLAKNGAEFLQYCALRDGVIADYMQSRDAIFADARRADRQAAEAFFFNVWPRIEDFKDLGGGKFKLTYVWAVHGKTHRNLRIFVHFTRPEIPGIEHIGFQNDHLAPKPTNEWRPGEIIRDGPYTVTIPEAYRNPGRIGIHLGMFDEAGRVALGVDMTARTRCHVGDIVVERGPGGEVKLRYEPAKLKYVDPKVVEQMVLQRLNVGAKTVDFGPLLTDGCVILRKRGKNIVVISVPHGKPVRVGVREKMLPSGWRRLKIEAKVLRREGDILWIQPQ